MGVGLWRAQAHKERAREPGELWVKNSREGGSAMCALRSWGAKKTRLRFREVRGRSCLAAGGLYPRLSLGRERGGLGFAPVVGDPLPPSPLPAPTPFPEHSPYLHTHPKPVCRLRLHGSRTSCSLDRCHLGPTPAAQAHSRTGAQGPC